MFFNKNNDQKDIDELKAFRDIGETFNYLGLTMIVVSHTGFNSIPLLKCDYVDNNGQLHQISFGINELPTLKAQNIEVKT